MSIFCPYCHQLKKASEEHNYCSKVGDNIHAPKSNAFYLNSNQLHSGEHVSRLSIRSVLDGYQYYKTGAKESLVKKDNYLIINEGQSWQSEIISEQPVEMLVVAFDPGFIRDAVHSFTKSPSKLLDSPVANRIDPTIFSENTYPSNKQLSQLFFKLKEGIAAGQKEELYFEQIYFELFQMMFLNHQTHLKKVDLLPSKKAAVREELFRRLGCAKDYIEAHFRENLTLEDISKVAALSPFHFLRLFKKVYHTTPHRYLVEERMKAAHYFLRTTVIPVQDISDHVGFENPASFGRVFKRYFEQTPLQVRH